MASNDFRARLMLRLSSVSCRRQLWFARLVVGLLMALLVLAFVLAAPLRFNQLLSAAIVYSDALESFNLSAQFFAFYSLIPETVLLLAFLGVGLILLKRRFDDLPTLFMALTITLAFTLFAPTLEVLLYTADGRALLAWVLYAISLTLTITFFFVFPDGRFVPAWTRWLAVGWAILTCLTPWVFLTGFNTLFIVLVYGAGYFPGYLAQIYRYVRVSTPLQRQQTKWVVLGAILAVSAAGVGGVVGRTLLSALFSSSPVLSLIF